MIDMATASVELRVGLAVLNMALCTGIGYSCLCRIASMSRETTCCHYRALYVLLAVAATASGFGFLLFREWPGPGQILFSTAFLYYLYTGKERWRGGPPDYARTRK